MPDHRYEGPLEKVNDCCWRIPKSYKAGMRVDGLIYVDEHLLELIRNDPAPEQVANVAVLPGIQRASLAMPDIHWGYGFPIGGVCATDPEDGGVISPGGVGYDINCGVRLVRSNLSRVDVQPNLTSLVKALFVQVPGGVCSASANEWGTQLKKLMSLVSYSTFVRQVRESKSQRLGIAGPFRFHNRCSYAGRVDSTDVRSSSASADRGVPPGVS